MRPYSAATFGIHFYRTCWEQLGFEGTRKCVQIQTRAEGQSTSKPRSHRTPRAEMNGSSSFPVRKLSNTNARALGPRSVSPPRPRHRHPFSVPFRCSSVRHPHLITGPLIKSLLIFDRFLFPIRLILNRLIVSTPTWRNVNISRGGFCEGRRGGDVPARNLSMFFHRSECSPVTSTASFATC